MVTDTDMDMGMVTDTVIMKKIKNKVFSIVYLKNRDSSIIS